MPFLSTLAHNITEHTLSSMLACIITTVGPGLSFHTGTQHQYTLSSMPTRTMKSVGPRYFFSDPSGTQHH